MHKDQWISLGMTTLLVGSLGVMLDISPEMTLKIMCAYVVAHILSCMFVNYQEKKKWQR